MQLDRLLPTLSQYWAPPVPHADVARSRESTESVSSSAATDVAAAEGANTVRRLIGNLDIRSLSPRQMAETSLDLYVAGVVPWDEYAMIAFQPELHPDYDRTIGSLTGEPAAPDRPRDFLALWEERLDFDQRYNGDDSELIARTERIVGLFRQIDRPTSLMV